MTPERWEQIKQLFHSALKYEAAERSDFLSGACAGDESLRQTVESLISSHEKTVSIINAPAYKVACDVLAEERHELQAGQTFASYEIISFVSKGGMGEVYLAQDRRLSRKIALKLLPSAFTRDLDRLRRFEQEARAVSALNHPNILTIYEIKEIDSIHVIATEFVEGETLRQLLLAGPIDLNKALNIAIQVSDALSAAHKTGIIHRDIKPENIMVRPD